MFDPFSHLSLADKKTRLTELNEAYIEIAIGNQENYINDFGSGHVIYTTANLDKLQQLITMLKNSIDVEEGSTTANTPRAVGIRFV